MGEKQKLDPQYLATQILEKIVTKNRMHTIDKDVTKQRGQTEI